MSEKLEAPIKHPKIYLGNKRAGSKHKLRDKNDILVNIDRPSGSILGNRAGGNKPNRVDSIIAYETWFIRQMKINNSEAHREVIRIVNLIRSGKTVCLMCWCFPKPCHGRVIMNYIISLLEQ